MDPVIHDHDRHFTAVDAREALTETIESELEILEGQFQTTLEHQGTFVVPGIGNFTLLTFLQFLTTEEFHPQQGYYWLAVQQLANTCDHDESSRLSGWEIRHYAAQRGYCNG